MRRALLGFAAFFLLSGFTLTWENPTTNSNGTPITDLAEVQVYQSTTPGVYGTTPLGTVSTNVPGATVSYTGTNPERGTFYWVVKACDSSGNCSLPSNEATKTFLDQTAPDAAGNLRVD